MKELLALILVVLMAVSVLAACGDKGENNTNTTSDVAITQGDNAVDVTIPVTTEAPTVNTLTEDVLFGKWNMAVNMIDLVTFAMDTEAVLGEDEKQTLEASLDILEPMFEGIEFNLDVEFKTAGEYVITISEEKMETMVTDLSDNIVNYLKNGGLEDMLALQGMEISMEDFEEALAQQGLTMDDYYDVMSEQIKTRINVEELFGQFDEQSGEYAITEDYLLIDMGTEEDLGISSKFKYNFDGTAITLLETIDGELHPYTGSVLTKTE